MKKIFALALAAAVLMSLASCNNAHSMALTVMGRKSDMEKSYMKSVFESYERDSGKKLRLVCVEDGEFERKARESLSSDNAPDILLHFNNADLTALDVEDNFLYLNDEPWVSDLTDSALAYCLDGGGNLLGLPYWESSVSGCYYNKTVLDSLGLRPASTQAEFDTLCQALAELGYTPICWPGDGCSWMPQLALDPVFADDPELLEKINKNEVGYADIPAVTSMVSWINNAAKSGWFGDRHDYLDCGWGDISPALSSGDAVMTFIWDTWFYTDFTPGKYSVDDFALMPVFMGAADGGTYEGGNLNMMMVSKKSERTEEALDFLRFCAAPENYNEAFAGISTVSSFRGQNTNIQSKMVTDAARSISKLERVSTASTRVVGYNAEDVCRALISLMKGDTTVPETVRLMDHYRLASG